MIWFLLESYRTNGPQYQVLFFPPLTLIHILRLFHKNRNLIRRLLYLLQFNWYLLQFDWYTCGKLNLAQVLLTLGETFKIVSIDYQLFDRENGFVLEDRGSWPEIIWKNFYFHFYKNLNIFFRCTMHDLKKYNKKF